MSFTVLSISHQNGAQSFSHGFAVLTLLRSKVMFLCLVSELLSSWRNHLAFYCKGPVDTYCSFYSSASHEFQTPFRWVEESCWLSFRRHQSGEEITYLGPVTDITASHTVLAQPEEEGSPTSQLKKLRRHGGWVIWPNCLWEIHMLFLLSQEASFSC